MRNRISIPLAFVTGCAVAIGFPAAGAASGPLDEIAPPPAVEATGASEDFTRPLFASKDGVVEYSHGDPTDEEQRFLWLMNRARNDPSAEADRILVDYGHARVTSAVNFFMGVDPTGDFTRQENHDAFDSYLRQPPFAMNADLLALSRSWSQVQKDTNSQRHPGQKIDPDDVNEVPEYTGLGDYLTQGGYSFSSAGQSVYAFSDDMLHAHAAFAIDWGQGIDAGTGRPGLGHRNNLMNFDDTDSKDFREAGVGVVQNANPGQNEVGPKVVTVDLGRPTNANLRFVTGVCYEDLNQNGEYDLGEGVEGVRIDVSASSHYAITSASGGYAVPVDKDDGEVEITTTPTADIGSAVIGSQSAFGDTFEINPSGGNILMDFLPPPESPQSDSASITVSGGTTTDGDTVEKTFSVGAFDVNNPTVGDLDLAIDLDHADRGELLVELRSPAGTTIVLFDGKAPGDGLRGVFDGSIAPRDPLSTFLGEPYQGDWKLRVTDAAGGASGTFGDCTLTIFPAWVRNIHAPRSCALFTKVKFKDSAKPAKDAVTLKLTLDVGAQVPSTITETASLVVRSLETGFPELFSVDLSQVPAAKLVPSNVKLKARVNLKDTSKALVSVNVKGLDLPPLPERVRVDLALGDLLVSQQVALTKGAYNGRKTPVEDQLFWVDKIVSKEQFGVNVTTVKGRFSKGGAPVVFGDVVEFKLGDFASKPLAASFVQKRTRHTHSGLQLSKLIIDTRTGTFTARVFSQSDVVVDGKIRVELRVGDFLGVTDVLPNTSGPKIKY